MSRMTIALAGALTAAMLASGGGCVTVDTPSARVEVGPANLFHVGSGSADSRAPGETPYARPLRKVSHQHSKVAEELVEAEWDEVVEKSGKWAEYARELNAQAGASHDPSLFRRYCEELLTAIGQVQQAGLRRDYRECQRRLDACGNIINKITRTFPLTVNEAMAAARRADRTTSRDDGTAASGPQVP